MAESGEGEEIGPRGNDWEVVSLTASAYAAAPGPKPVEDVAGDKGSVYEEDKLETSQAMFMSRHFVYPTKHPEDDVPMGPELENSQVPKEQKIVFDSLQANDESAGSVDKDGALKGSAINEENLDAQVIDGKESAAGTVSPEVQKSITQPVANVVKFEKSVHHSAHETISGGASASDVKTTVSELTAPFVDPPADGPADVTSSKSVKDKKKDRSGVPCAPWWKRQAASLYEHVKEANPLWSIVIAAAVMGLAVIGHRWQQRKSHVSPLKLQFNAKEEKPGKMLGPMTRLKEAFVSGSHGSRSTRSHISSEI